MRFSLRLVLCGVILSAPFAARSQETAGVSVAQASPAKRALIFAYDLPDAPVPQVEAQILASSSDQQSAALPAPSQSSAGQASVQGTSSSESPAQSNTDKSQHDKAADELKEQEHQRVAGVMATFNTTSNRNALPLPPGQKFQLFFRSAIDPWPFLLAGVVSGIGQADDSYPVWGQGMQGYAKRYGAAYSDAFIGNFFGNAVLPIVLHEDPRYFQKGTGTAKHRFLWAASSTVWCRRDNGSWGPNYANVGGNLIGSAIARAYYPASERTVTDVISDGLTVSAEGIVGAEVIEFWPDLARHLRRKRDEKLARQAAQRDAQNAAR